MSAFLAVSGETEGRGHGDRLGGFGPWRNGCDGVIGKGMFGNDTKRE